MMKLLFWNVVFILVLLNFVNVCCKKFKVTSCESQAAFGHNSRQDIFMHAKMDDKQRKVDFTLIGLPAYTRKEYDLEVMQQKVQWNCSLPLVDAQLTQKVIDSLIQTREVGKCWTLTGTITNLLKDVGSPAQVLAGLFCFKDVFTPLEVTDLSDRNQRNDRYSFYKDCTERAGATLVRESMYTNGSIMTSNFAETTECYAQLPCFECDQEVYEIRRDDTVVWNLVQYEVDIQCSKNLDPIPAASVMQCLQEGGRFIKSIKVPPRKLRCVSTQCEERTELIVKVNEPILDRPCSMNWMIDEINTRILEDRQFIQIVQQILEEEAKSD